MEGIDISKAKIPDFGPLSLTWYQPMYIDDERWSNVISYVWSQLLCFDVYKAIVKNWKTGFPNYLKTFKYEHDSKKYYKPLRLQKSELQIKTMIDSLKLFVKTIDDSISGLDTLIQLLQNWDSIDSSSSPMFMTMKKSLESSLEEKNRKILDKEGNVVKEISGREAFIQFFNNLPFAGIIKPGSKGKTGKSVKAGILSKIDENEEFDITNSEIRQQVSDILEDKLNELEAEKLLIEKEIQEFQEKLKQQKQIEYFSKLELKQTWKNLPKSEKKKFEHSLKEEFLTMMYQCRLAKFKEYLTVVYENVVQNDEYRTLLMESLPNLEEYFKTGKINFNRIIYIDPFSAKKPLLGVTIVNHVPRGPNNVGRVLMDLRKELVFKKKEHLDEKVLEKALNTKKRFLLAHGKLQDLLRQRDVKEFIGLSVDEIIQRLNDAYKIHTPNRSYLVFPDCNKMDCKKLTLANIKDLLREINLEDVEVQSFSKVKIDFPELTSSSIDFIMQNDINGVKKIFDYEEMNPGNLANFSRKEHLGNLYNIQVEEEKMNILRAVVEFMYLSDTQKRVRTSEIEAIITKELSELPRQELDALVSVIDTVYNNGDNALDDLVLDECDDCEKQITVKTKDGEQDYDMSEYVQYALDRDVRLGKLVSRVREADVIDAEKWKFIKSTSKMEVDPTDEILEDPKEELLDIRDVHISSLLGLDPRGDGGDEGEVAGIFSSISTEEKHNMKMSGDIIFSSFPGQYQPFELSPTVRIICTIDYFKFPTVLHAVCYLWFTREFKIPRKESYQMLLKENWKDLLVSLRMFEDINEIPFNEFKIGLESKGLDKIAVDIEENLKKRRKSSNLVLGPNEAVDQDLGDLPVSKALLKHELMVRLLDSKKYQENPFVPWNDAYTKLIRMMDKNTFDIAKKALDKAHSIKFDSKTMKELLTRTGSGVLYHGDLEDPVLGIGSRRNGLNLAGHSLMELRDALREQTSDILEPDDEDTKILVYEFTNRLNLFGRLLQTLIQKFGDLDLAIKLARGFLVLYKVNCGSGEGAPFKITSQLQHVVRDISRKHRERSKNINSLLWDYIRIMYGYYVNTVQLKPTVSQEKSCMFPIDEKNIKKDTEEKAKVIVTKLLRCLLKEFGSQDKLDKIDEIAGEIISSNKGRAKYIGNLKLKNLSQIQREQIINGELEHHEM